MQQISTISIGQTVFENPEIAFKRLGLCYKDTGLQRQLKWRYAESIGYPCGVVFKYVEPVVGSERQRSDTSPAKQDLQFFGMCHFLMG